jgi:membrane associated rhomboid family serine protease
MSAPQQGGNPFLQSYQAWSERTPYVARVSTVFLIIIYLVTWFVKLDTYLADVPYYTVYHFQLWRIITSPLVGNSILTIILILLTYPSLGVKMESSMGSSAFLWLIVLLGLTVNTCFNVICVSFYYLGTSDGLLWTCMDFWTVLFALITMDCLLLPDAPRRLLFIPYDIPSKYIPLALYFIICLFSGFVLSYALSMVVGYGFMKGYFDKLRPSSHYLQELETTGWLHSVSRSRYTSYSYFITLLNVIYSYDFSVLNWPYTLFYTIFFVINRGWVLAGTLGHDSWIPVSTADPSEHGPSSSSSASSSSATTSSATGGGFFSGFGGANTASAGADEESGPRDMFPGSGRKLSATTSSSSNSSSTSSSSTTANTNWNFAMPTVAAPPATATTVEAVRIPAREELAAKRLAVLQQQSNNSSNTK